MVGVLDPVHLLKLTLLIEELSKVHLSNGKIYILILFYCIVRCHLQLASVALSEPPIKQCEKIIDNCDHKHLIYLSSYYSPNQDALPPVNVLINSCSPFDLTSASLALFAMQ